MCKACAKQSIANKRNYCPYCYLLHNPEWDKLNKEFEEMLIDIGIKGGNQNGINKTIKKLS